MQINLDKKEIYYTGDLNRQQSEVLLDWLKKNDTGWEETDVEELEYLYGYDSLRYSNESWEWELNEEQTKNAKELFYTLENVQVDCRELSEDQIKEMADVFEKAGYKAWDDPDALKKIQDDDDYLRLDWVDDFYINCKSDTKTIITYEKFMELFGGQEVLKPTLSQYFKDLTPIDNPPFIKADSLGYIGQIVDNEEESSAVTPKEIVKYLSKKDIFLTPKQYKKLWKKS